MVPPRDPNDVGSDPLDLFGDDGSVDGDAEDTDEGDATEDAAYNAFIHDVLNPDNSLYDSDEANDVPEAPNDESTSPIIRALGLLSEAGITLSELLEGVLFGDRRIRDHRQVVAARTELLKSSALPRSLERIRRPPQMRVRGQAHLAARAELETWALKTSTEILRKELVEYAMTTKAPETEKEVVSEESLKEMTFDALSTQVEQCAPQLYGLLSDICVAKRGNRKRKRDSQFCLVIFINALSNQISRQNNRMQKLLCIYFKAKGVPKSVYYLFHRCGIIESYAWSVNALSNISDAAMAEAVRIFKWQPCLIIHDNIRLAFPVKHQRGDHLTTTDNGTAMTMLPLRDVTRARALLRNPTLWKENQLRVTESYRRDTMSHFSNDDLFGMNGFKHEKERTISNILVYLFNIPLVQQSKLLRDSGKRSHKLLAEAPPVHQLPYGPEHRNIQFMLRTSAQEEATYGGNNALTKEAPRQLEIDSQEALEHWAANEVTPWVGDSLTVQRLRNLQLMKCEDTSTLERLEHIIPTFGWFHLDMNLVNAIFYHHYAEDSSTGLARDATGLHRSGLTKPTKKRGPQYHTGDEFLQHTTTARLRELWLWATGTEDLKGLVKWVESSTPKSIRSTAEKIWTERASNRAIERYKDEDTNLCNSITLTRDLLLRHEVWASTKSGDVGRMENTLPMLLVFFLGAGASNYAKEIAEMLHWRLHEAPPGVADLIRDECWVINTQGRSNTFYPLDLRQELNNLSIKEHGPPAQGCTWEAHRKWAPALPVLTSVVQHVDECFHDFYRSRKHYVPDPEGDIKLLMARHATFKIHEHLENRPANEQESRTLDCFEAGRVKLSKNYLKGLARDRSQFLTYRSSLELPASSTTRGTDEIIDEIKTNSQAQADGTMFKGTRRLVDALQAEADRIGDDELFYGRDQHEGTEHDFEDIRLRLTDAWN